MNRADLQNLSRLRRREAYQLLQAGHFCGAYYLAGLSVECALKACIAKKVNRYDFPDRALAQRVYTHNLEQLQKDAGLESIFKRDADASPLLELNWAVVKDWSVESRYDLTISEALARDLYSACTSRRYGVLAWIRQHW